MSNDKYNHKNEIVYLNQYHVIFCPKYRRKVLVGDIEKDLKEILYEVAKENSIRNHARSCSFVHFF